MTRYSAGETRQAASTNNISAIQAKICYTLVFALRDAAAFRYMNISCVNEPLHTRAAYTYIKKSKTNQPTQLRCISCRTGDQTKISFSFCLGIQYSYVTTTDDTEKRNLRVLQCRHNRRSPIIHIYIRIYEKFCRRAFFKFAVLLIVVIFVVCVRVCFFFFEHLDT